MTDGFSDMTPEGKKYFAELNKLKKLEVRVGFQRGEAVYEDGADLVDIAAFNELGTSSTPSRPFMKQSFENHEKELRSACKMVNDSLAKGGTAEDALKKLGVACKGLVQQEIVEGEFEPNAPSTVEKKGSSRPLVDTGFMRQSVQFVVGERK